MDFLFSNMHSFSFSSLIAVSMTYKTILINGDRVGTMILMMILEEMLTFDTIENNVCWEIFLYDLSYVEVGIFHAYLWSAF